MSEDEIHPRSSPDKKGRSANVPVLLTVLSAIMTAVIGGYVAWTTKGMETREQRRITEIQTGSQKSIAEMQKDAQQAIAQDTLKGQLAIADKQGQAQKDVAGTQRETERYMADARTRADREIASLSERTKNQLGNQQDSVERAKLFSGLVNELADPDAHKSSVALLVLWQLYQSDGDRSVIIATALAVENSQIVETLKMLGVRDQRSLELIKYYGKQGTPQQQATAKVILGAINFSGVVGTGQKAEIEAELTRYQEYLRDLGFATVQEKVNVNITTADLAFYEGGDKTMMTLGKNIARDENIVLREYSHHILGRQIFTEGDQYSNGYRAIESGLASYFACSHTGNSVSTWRGATDTILIDLENDDQVSALDFENVSNMGARVWGGIFWQIRKLLGKDPADRLLFQTFTSIGKFHGSGQMTPAYQDFVKKLLETDRTLSGEENQKQIRSILQRRGLTL